MKHISLSDARAFFRGKLNEPISAAEQDSAARAIFITYHEKKRAYSLVIVGEGYACSSIYDLLDEVSLSKGNVVAYTVLPGRVESSGVVGVSETKVVDLSEERERELNLREKRLEKREAALVRRETDLARTEEELKRIAEQHMEDSARQEIL
ncbi:MAG: hypothetical protein MK080_04400 [Opitutales bacterium]|nr:hypothetical protein [Opitutales bacterium]NRA26833.1 hypothetical protein [Opitutales bacterium]